MGLVRSINFFSFSFTKCDTSSGFWNGRQPFIVASIYEDHKKSFAPFQHQTTPKLSFNCTCTIISHQSLVVPKLPQILAWNQNGIKDGDTTFSSKERKDLGERHTSNR